MQEAVILTSTPKKNLLSLRNTNLKCECVTKLLAQIAYLLKKKASNGNF